MEAQSSDIQRQIKLIQKLFCNKQLDQFVHRVQTFIIPYLNKQQHLISQHMILKQASHIKQQQPKNIQNIKESTNKTNQSNNEIIKYQDPSIDLKQLQQVVNNIENNVQSQFDTKSLNQFKQSTIQQKQNQQSNQNNNNQIQNSSPSNLQLIKNQISNQSSNQSQQQTNQQKIINQSKKSNSQQQTNKPKTKTQSTKNDKQTQIQSLKHKSQLIAQALQKSKINILQKYQQMKLILFKIQRQMKKFQTSMHIKGSQWKVNKINNTSFLGVKTKGTLIQLRYQGIVQTNIFNLCVMIYLSQLWKQWVPFCTNSKTIAQPSPLQKIALLDLKIPFLTQRYGYLHGIAVDRITKNGKLYIYAQGISHQKDLLIQVHKADKAEYQKKVAKSVVLDAKFMVCQIGNQGNGKYNVKVYGMIDSHMPLLPQKIVNYIVKQLGGLIFEKIVKRAADIKGTAWQKQLKQNQKRQNKNPFYDWLNQRIKNWDKNQTAKKSKM